MGPNECRAGAGLGGGVTSQTLNPSIKVRVRLMESQGHDTCLPCLPRLAAQVRELGIVSPELLRSFIGWLDPQ